VSNPTPPRPAHERWADRFVQADAALTFDDVLLVPSYSESMPKDVDVTTQLTPRIRLKIPVLSSAMDTVTEARLATALALEGGLGVIHRNLPIEAQAAEVAKVKATRCDACEGAACDPRGRLLVGAAVGTGKDRAARVEALLAAGCDLVVVDTAHGHSRNVVEAVQELKRTFGSCEILAGNVATADGVTALVMAGADAVKVGIGPGSICTTRIVAGVGMPQLTAVLECAAAARRMGSRVVSDGGIQCSGDVVKALAAGAHAVMLGNLFAGVDEAPGDAVLLQGRSYKIYRGMGSLGAMAQGSKDRYFQEGVASEKLVPEGVEGRVPAKGPLARTLAQLVGGLRAGMGYLGCPGVEALRTRPRFVRITNAGLAESHVHHVTVPPETADSSR